MGDPVLVSPTCQVCIVAAQTVEFWQGDVDRMRTRVRYHRLPDRWEHTLLRP